MNKQAAAAFAKWQKSMVEIQPRDGEFSAAELARQMKCGKDAAIRRIREMLGAGVVRYVGLSARVDITGRRQMIPTYALVTERATIKRPGAA